MKVGAGVRVSFVLMLTGATGASLPGDAFGQGQIVFTTDRDHPNVSEEIYVMNPDGSGQTRLTDNDASDNGGAWSPNTKTIAFHSNRDGNPQIFLMNADGTDQRLLVGLGSLGAVFPTWSQNGNRVCFNSVVRPRDIFVVRADGTGLENLTNHPSDDLRCDWSPNGQQIAFGSTRDGNEEVYVMNADGSDPVRLTDSAGVDANPDWSPNGQQIAFESNRDGNPEIYVMNADGTDPVRLTDFAGQDTKPSWSPNGQQIAFHRRIAGNLQVFAMNADGSDVTAITATAQPAFSGFPDWGGGHLHPEEEED